MSDPNATYRFVSWVRQGMAAAITKTDDLKSSLPAKVDVIVSVAVTGQNEQGAIQQTATQWSKLYGPGDVIGLDSRQVIRTEPKHRTADFEPNFCPVVEFDRPDLPWLFTPAAAVNTTAPLRPWLCLVVVRKQPGVTLTTNANAPLPVLRIDSPANPAQELPDLSESWAWAHTQIAGQFSSPTELETLLEAHPELTIARLICPRKLEPQTSYYACVVPTFDAGRQAGLGQTPTASTLNPAWTATTLAPFDLPVYYHWEFTTGAGGSFEALARRLTPRKLPQVGFRQLDATAPGGGLPAATTTVMLQMEGALMSNDAAPVAWTEAQRKFFQDNLRPLLNQTATAASDLLAPPVYGGIHASQTTVPAADPPQNWLAQLNLDPRYRAAAGLGTRVVQQNQEQLMASAWAQAGDVNGANRTLRLGQLAREIGSRLLRRHFNPQSTGALLQLTQAVHNQLRVRAPLADNPPLAASTLPVFRRIARRRGLLGRRLYKESNTNAGTLLEEINAGKIALAPVRARELPLAGTADLNTITTALALTYEPLKYVSFRILKVDYDTAGWTKTAWPKPPLVARAGTPAAAPLDESLPTMIANFKAAVKSHQGYLDAGARLVGKAAVKEFLSLADKWQTMRTDVLSRLDPGVTVKKRIKQRLQVRGPIWQSAALWGRTEPLDPVTLAPKFPVPMYKALRELSQELFLPGLGSVPPETVAVLVPNRRFIEAYMVGLNHEMSRELLWRDYPAARDATYFEYFWSAPKAVDDGTQPTNADIAPINLWDKNKRLGENAAVPALDNFVVLIVRGELLRRYPTTVIYACKAATDTALTKRTLSNPEEVRYPVFSGRLEPDINFFAFDLLTREARGSTVSTVNPGWFFIFQEQPVEPRFGLDEAVGFPTTLPAAASDLTWSHVVANADALKQLTHIRLTGTPLDGKTIGGLKWGQNSAQMAAIMQRLTARIAIHADALIEQSAALPLVVTNIEYDTATGAPVAVTGSNRDGTRWRLTKQQYDDLRRLERAEFYFTPPLKAI
jgi:hypothetical protein